MATAQQQLTIARKLIESPAAFNRYVLGRPAYWSKQLEICRALRSGISTILVPSGNATGKSWLSAGLVLWYLATKPNGIVVTTAPTTDQLANVLWRAIFGAIDQSPAEFLGLETRMTRQPLLIERSKTNYAIGMSTTKQEASTGHHAADLLVLVDEASGVDDERIAALNSLNPSQVILIGNPLVPSGVFYERVTRQELDPDPRTALVRIRSDETPAVLANEYRSKTGLADLSFLERARRDYGEGSPWWMSHVEAKFPDTAEGQLIETAWIDACYGNEPDREVMTRAERGENIMAVDIATGRGGDSSVWLVRDDVGIIDGELSNTIRPEQWAEIVVKAARKYNVRTIVYDATGLGETFGVLLANAGFINSIGFQGGRGTSNKFENLRAASYWNLRRRLSPAVSPTKFHIPERFFFRLRKELLATKYELTSKDKTAIVSKDDIVARIGHSPDIADTLSMTYAFLNL